MLVLDGKLVGETRRELLKPRVQNFTKLKGRAPSLAVILVGHNTASEVYVRNKAKACASVGIHSETFSWDASISLADFETKLAILQKRSDIDGILVQLPLPKQLSSIDLGEVLNPLKDPDCFAWSNQGRQAAGQSRISSCTPQGVMSILKHYNISVEGKNAVVVGRSLIVGRPMSWLLTEAGATVTVCHSKTQDLSSFTRNADLVVVAAGKANMLGKIDFKQGSVVVDVGIHGAGGGKLCGDVRFEELQNWCLAATPVPGGVGPMTITSLLENTMTLAEASL